MRSAAFETVAPCAVAPLLAENDADVWLFDLDLPQVARDALFPLLDDAERKRAAAFAFAHLQAHHVSAHGQMRRILSAYAERPARELRIRLTPEGKPFLSPLESPAFNLSHSGGLGLLAVTRSAPIGVDIERIRHASDLAGIASSTFSAAENAALTRLPEARRTEAFFACWSRKEAVGKFDGRGLGLEPASFTVPVDPDAPPDAAGDLVEIGATRPVRLFDVPVPSGFRGAVAALPGTGGLRFFRLPAEWPA